MTTRETVGTATKKGMLYHVNIITTGEKFRPRLRPKREISSNKDMERAFLCIKENNFKEEIMQRSNRIEEDMTTSPSYTLIKEDKFQNDYLVDGSR